MDIRYHVLWEWVKHNLIILKQVDTTINEADHFTKILARVLFHRSIDYNMGCASPEYSSAHLRSTGQFDTAKLQLAPDTFTMKNTMTLPISIGSRPV